MILFQEYIYSLEQTLREKLSISIKSHIDTLPPHIILREVFYYALYIVLKTVRISTEGIDMHLLLMALIGITTTQPAILDQTDEEWTAPGYNVIEEVSINPLDYGEPISWGENCNGPTASIGCQGFFVPTENGEKWRIIMLLKDKIVVLQEGEEAREILLTCSPRGIIYSRNGNYALIVGSVLDSSREAIYSIEAEFVDIDYDSSVGFSMQAGLDYDLDDKWFLNLDIKKLLLKTDVTVDTGEGILPVEVDINPLIIGVGVGMRF